MLTSFGKFCRKLRIDNGELLKDMADKLGVTSSYLSAIENGKRNVPQQWIKKITELYDLNDAEAHELKVSARESQKTIKIDFEGFSKQDKNDFMALARQFTGLNEDDKAKIKNILLKNNKKEE